MTFDFIAIDKLTGREVPSQLTIADPVFVDGGVSSAVTFEGFDSLSTKIHGAFSFQAAALAFDLARTLMAGHEDRWDFHFGDDGPTPFDWSPEA